MVRLSDLREYSLRVLGENKIEEARADTDFLLFFLLGAEKADIIFGEKEVDNEKAQSFYDALDRRIKGEPVQYITGVCEFYSNEFYVDKTTLIPRADTEILVDECIKRIKEKKLSSFIDIGTGSGCIALSILKETENTKASLIDIQEGALKVAEKNAKKLGVCERTSFYKKDILNEDLKGFDKVDLIVSNPPYIDTETILTLDDKVKNFEPNIALDGGADGLMFYRRITHLASKMCKYLAFEIGFDQKDSVREIMEEYFTDIKLYYDYGKNPRALIGKNKQIN